MKSPPLHFTVDAATDSISVEGREEKYIPLLYLPSTGREIARATGAAVTITQGGWSDSLPLSSLFSANDFMIATRQELLNEVRVRAQMVCTAYAPKSVDPAWIRFEGVSKIVTSKNEKGLYRARMRTRYMAFENGRRRKNVFRYTDVTEFRPAT